jgi:hypothetical protein
VNIDIKQIKSFFFKAMAEGWAASGEKKTVSPLPGYKAITFQDENYYLIDCYCVNPSSDKSAGITTIYFQDNPVWIMNYGGCYEKQVIDFLKLALTETINKQEFIGGRGPQKFAHREFKGLMYINNPVLFDFSEFKGREEVYDFLTGIHYGYHDYWGMSLL